MNGVALLIPIALLLGLGGLAAFSGRCRTVSMMIWTTLRFVSSSMTMVRRTLSADKKTGQVLGLPRQFEELGNV